MTNKITWSAAPTSRGTVLTTEMDGLTSTSYTALGTEIDNTTNLDQWAAAHLHVGSFTPTTGGYWQLFLVQELAATYADAPKSTNPGGDRSVAVVSFNAATAVQESATAWFRIPPGKFKFVLLNKSGANFPANSNTLTLYTADDLVN